MYISVKTAPTMVALMPVDALCERSVRRLLKGVNAGPETSITVAGPLAGEAMSALWRRGILRVEAARRIISPAADQRSQTLLIMGCASAAQVVATVDNVLAVLVPGGFLGIDASRIAAPADRIRLRQMLAHRGLRSRAGTEIHGEIILRRPDLEEAFALAS